MATSTRAAFAAEAVDDERESRSALRTDRRIIASVGTRMSGPTATRLSLGTTLSNGCLFGAQVVVARNRRGTASGRIPISYELGRRAWWWVVRSTDCLSRDLEEGFYHSWTPVATSATASVADTPAGSHAVRTLRGDARNRDVRESGVSPFDLCDSLPATRGPFENHAVHALAYATVVDLRPPRRNQGDDRNHRHSPRWLPVRLRRGDAA